MGTELNGANGKWGKWGQATFLDTNEQAAQIKL